MKKIILTLVVAASCMVAKAQVWAGGELTFWRDYDANTTTLNVLPEIGYSLNDKWDVAASFGYAHKYISGTKGDAFVIEPYARYKWCTVDRVTFLTDMNVGFAFGKTTPKGGSSSGTGTSYEIGIKPGIAVSLNSTWALVAHFGFLGYRDMNDKCAMNHFGDNGFGLDLKNGLSFGAYYNF